jgi:chondroitin 4-sulfotransferase 11
MWVRYRIMELRGRSLYSGYADEYSCIFIHIPKTAGTSVTSALFGAGSRHVRWDAYFHANQRKFSRYFKFAFVRNPWDRVLSAYTFLKRGGMDPADAVWADRHLQQFDTFEQFVLEWLSEERIWSWVHFVPQYHWIYDTSLQCKMDFVGRMENIDADFRVVASRLGCNANLKEKNRSRFDNYRTHYTDEMRLRVTELYARDIQLFGYNFES